MQLLNYNRIEPNNSFSYIRWKGCNFAFGEYAILNFYDFTHHVEVIDSELSWANNGIYNLSSTNSSANNYIYSGLYIHDIGLRESNYDSDAHGIGIQGGHSGLIDNNLIERAGSGITLYTFTNQELKNTCWAI